MSTILTNNNIGQYLSKKLKQESTTTLTGYQPTIINSLTARKLLDDRLNNIQTIMKENVDDDLNFITDEFLEN